MEFVSKFLTEKDKEKISLAVQLHTPLEIMSYTLPREKERYIQEILMYFLLQCHQEHMTDNLVFCLSELLTNAKKANTKRVYFKEKNLDINNEMDYHQGMVTCKEETLSNIEHYLTLQKEAGLYIKLILQLNDDGITIEIRNNAVITKFEKKRILEKLRVAEKYEEPHQVVSLMVDQTEGAGLGIIIIVLMLRKIGLSRNNYKVFTNETETITQMLLPLNQEIDKQMDSLYEEFVDNLKTIPVFEDVLEQFTKMTANADDNALIEFISKDVSLAAILLKDAAAKGHSCSKISTAFKVLGREDVVALLSKENPVIRLIKKEDDVRQMWKHETDVAFYAYNIAKNTSEFGFDLEEVYVSALFHDIECLLLEVATDEQKQGVKKLADSLDSTGALYQMFLKDFGHSHGCYKIAQSWGLPETVAQVVRYHNNPSFAPEKLQPIVYAVYLADILQYYEKGQAEFYQIHKEALDFFQIHSKGQLDFLVEQLKK
ncbi:MAG: HDOD domain-containing protein [Treponema sp.]|nr:HDOD domain-containing protein [Treponema sp.]MBR4791317.1 HDOD domain-containing protein [Treponema sp.]